MTNFQFVLIHKQETAPALCELIRPQPNAPNASSSATINQRFCYPICHACSRGWGLFQGCDCDCDCGVCGLCIMMQLGIQCERVKILNLVHFIQTPLRVTNCRHRLCPTSSYYFFPNCLNLFLGGVLFGQVVRKGEATNNNNA